MKKDSMFYLGLIFFIFWVADAFYKTFILLEPQRTLWFSSAGLGITTLALLTRSNFLITSMFSALTAFESVWILGFFSQLLLHKRIPGVAEYAFQSGYPRWEFAITLYHLFLVPVLIYALIKTKKVHRFGWLGATLFSLVLGFLTYFWVGGKENVNCLFAIDYCRSFKSILEPLYGVNVIERIIIGVSFLSFFIFIPLNLVLLKMGKIFKKLSASVGMSNSSASGNI